MSTPQEVYRPQPNPDSHMPSPTEIVALLDSILAAVSAAPANKTELAALDFNTIPSVSLDGRTWTWAFGNYTANVDADGQQALFIESSIVGSEKNVGAWVGENDGEVDTAWFPVDPVDNSTNVQNAIYLAEFLGWTLVSKGPAQHFTNATPAIVVSTNFFRWVCETEFLYDSPTGTMFHFTRPDPESATVGTLIGVQIIGMRAKSDVAPATDGSGNIFMLATRVVQPIFEIRTDNFYRHYEAYGPARWVIRSCRTYGNTAWPQGVSIGGSCFYYIDAFVFANSTRIPAANMEFSSGSEATGNFAAVANMQNAFFVRDCDGFFADVSGYVGLCVNANFRFFPSDPASVLTNIQLENFNDGGQDTAANCYDFDEPSVDYMTGNCSAIRIGGIISGPSGGGVRCAIGAMRDINIHATIRSCGGFALNFVRGSGFNVASTSLFDNFADINNPTDAVITGIETLRTDKSRLVATSPSMEIPPSHSFLHFTGSEQNVATWNGGWEGRIIKVLHRGAQRFLTTGNLVPTGNANLSTTGTTDTSMWVYHAVDAKWYQMAYSNN